MRLTTCEGCGRPYRKTRRTRYSRCPDCIPAQAPNPRHEAEYLRNRAIVLAGDPPCFWCAIEKATTADHLKPTAEGGDHSVRNLVPSCGSCNARRGGKQRRHAPSTARPSERILV